jgi:uncharacterized lipoprotein YddW (UPF0748 family)
MSRTAKYINQMETVQPVNEDDLVPSDGAKIDIAANVAKLAKWAEYRKAGVTELVRDVYRRAKQARPKAQVTAAVFTPVKSAERVYQDWPGWLREGIIDYVIPMAYTPKNEQLASNLDDWKNVDPHLHRIVPGLCLSAKRAADGDYIPRDVELIFTQYRMCQDAGARAVNFYALDNTDAQPMLMLTEPLIAAMRSGPFADKVPVVYPVSRAPK